MNRFRTIFRNFSTTTRIAFSMAMWTATVLLCLRVLGFLEDGHEQVLQHRTRLAEMVAVSCSQLASCGRDNESAVLLSSLAKRNPDILSSGLRLVDGNLEVATSNHKQIWEEQQDVAMINRIKVPVFEDDQIHSNLEIAFKPPVRSGLLGFLSLPSVQIILLACLLNFLGFRYWLAKCFREFDPTRVVPDRVRNALDTLAEGVLVVDENQHIMFANRHIADAVNEPVKAIIGRSVKDLPWANEDGDPFKNPEEDLQDKELTLQPKDGIRKVFKINRSPIMDEDGRHRGALLSFDDITVLRQQHDDLQQAMQEVEQSRAEVAKQNEQLTYLATRDSMTGCFNRRWFMETFEKIWQSGQRYRHPVSCIMVDVDHFKAVNDTHGHATGDDVLKQVAEVLLDTTRDSDVVCRYGGEEFCILLPHVDLAGAVVAAERYRQAISKLKFEDLTITASLGCSDREQGCELAEQMLDQADQALYHAKRTGRNQVCRFDEIEKVSSDSAAVR